MPDPLVDVIAEELAYFGPVVIGVPEAIAAAVRSRLLADDVVEAVAARMFGRWEAALNGDRKCRSWGSLDEHDRDLWRADARAALTAALDAAEQGTPDA